MSEWERHLDSWPEVHLITGVSEHDGSAEAARRFWNAILDKFIECFPEHVDEYDIDLFIIQRRASLRRMFTQWYKSRRIIDAAPPA